MWDWSHVHPVWDWSPRVSCVGLLSTCVLGGTGLRYVMGTSRVGAHVTGQHVSVGHTLACEHLVCVQFLHATKSHGQAQDSAPSHGTRDPLLL